MDQDRDEVYTEWLANAPKGVRWDKAQEMYELYQERRKQQAEDVAKRLLGKQTGASCPHHGTTKREWCDACHGEDWTDDD